MKHRLFLLLILGINLYTLSAQSPARTGKDYAIFFYVTDFEDKGWGRLPETRVEVNAIAAELETNYGFEVEIVPNPTKKGILDKITEVNGRSYGKEDQVLFFFSTHGYFSKDTDRGYLVPKDGKSNDPYGTSWISYDDLGSYITLNPSKHVLVGLDACYSGAFGDRYKGKPQDTPGTSSDDCTTQISRALSYDSRLYFTSGGRDQRTPAKSLFADRWLRTLRQGAEKGLIRTNDLRYQLSTIEYPLPEGGSFTSKHNAGGDFIFVHKTSCAPVIPPQIDSNQFSQRQQDINAYTTIKKQPTISNCQQYLIDFPRGGFRQEVSQQLLLLRDEQEWQYATLKGTIAAYQNYLDLYPKGLHANEARQRANAPVATTPIVKPPDHMVFVQGGTFEMGDVFGSGVSDEKPTHQVTVSDFYLGRHEVTFEEYDAFCDATKHKKPIDEGWGRRKRPIINVSWKDAVAYCNWRSEQEGLQKVYTITGSTVTANWNADGYRLPTEAEWEYAARSRGKKEKWAGTSEESNVLSYANSTGGEDGFKYTSPVGSLRANNLGLYDMSGNVWEWCWDWYGAYSAATQTDPRGLPSGSSRVLRSGSWDVKPTNQSCANRNRRAPNIRSQNIGFRLSRSADYPKGLNANEAQQQANAPVATPIVKPPDHMVFVHGGTFEMGDVLRDGDNTERPTHQVTVSDFYLGKYEVTFEEYDAFCDATKGEKLSDEGWGRGKRPITNVSWEDAVAYCNWRSEQESLQKVYTISGSTVTANWLADGYRLPTEAEWEYAARSQGEKEKWAGTSDENSLASYGNYFESAQQKGKDGYEYTSPVGSFRPNDLGLYDMSGNVWEWCWDGYGPYSSADQTDPRGPSAGSGRVLRGGSWYDIPANLRCANRRSNTPIYRLFNLGFRLSRAVR